MKPTEIQLKTALNIVNNGGAWQRKSDETEPRTWDPGDDGTNWLYVLTDASNEDSYAAVDVDGTIHN